jgi:hypothetical protein
LGDVLLATVTLALVDSLFTEGHRFPLADAQCSGGANTEAEARAIAQFLVQHSRLAIHKLDGSLGAGDNTQTATITQLFVDLNHLAYNHQCLHY